jgi:hypothetical protein
MFKTYIHVPAFEMLHDIIEKFRNVIGFLNVCGSIDGTYISRFWHLFVYIILMAIDIFNRKKFHSVVL